MNIRLTYFSAFSMLRDAKRFETALTDAGLPVEYGDGAPAGNCFDTIFREANSIIIDALGLSRAVRVKYNERLDRNIAVEVLYPRSGNPDYAIAEDYFYELTSEPDDPLPHLLWLVFVENDKESKEKLEAMTNIRLGDHWAD